MRSDWILDVLADLKTFARANELVALAEQLDDTSIVAMAEIAALREKQYRRTHDGEHGVGTHMEGLQQADGHTGLQVAIEALRDEIR